MNNETSHFHPYNLFLVTEHQEPDLFLPIKTSEKLLTQKLSQCPIALWRCPPIHKFLHHSRAYNLLFSALLLNMFGWRAKSHQAFKESSEMKGRDKIKRRKRTWGVGRGGMQAVEENFVL